MKRLIIFLISIISVLSANAQREFFDIYSQGQGLDLMKAHNFDAAIKNFDKACGIATPRSQERSRALFGKGMALYRIAQNMNLEKDYEGAYKKYAESMVCFRRIKRDKDVMDCVCSMAILNSSHFGYQDLAIEQYEYAFEIAKNLNLVDNQAEILGKIIKIYKSLHNEREVARYNAKIDSLVAANHSQMNDFNEYFDKGVKAYLNGDWDVAVSYFKKFLSSNPKQEKRFSALQKLRDTYSKMGDDKNAMVYSTLCVKDWVTAFRDNPSQKYIIYQNHYPFQIKVGDFAGALASIDSIQKSTFANGTELVKGELLVDKGRVYGLMGKWNDAVVNYRMADSLMNLSNQFTAVREKRESLIPLYAGALYQDNKLSASHQQYLRYLGIAKDSYGEKSMEYANALCYLANIEGFMDKLDDGTKHYIQSWEIARDISVQDLQFLPSSERGKYWEETNELIWNMIPYGIATGCYKGKFASSAFEALMFSKGLLLSTEKSVGRQVQESGNNELISDFMTVANLRNEIEQLRAENKGDRIMKVYSIMDSLDRALSSKLSAQNIIPTILTPSTAEIAKHLGNDDIIVDFADYIKNDGTHIYAAFILRHGMDAPKLMKVFEQSRLDSLLAENNGKYSDLYNDYNSRALYNIILESLMPEFHEVQKVYFIPSGILNQIAIEAIKLPDGNVLGDKYDIIRMTNSKEILTYNEWDCLNNFVTARLYGGLEYDVDSITMTAAAKVSEVPPLLALRGGTASLKACDGFKKLKMSEDEVIEIDGILSQNNITVNKFMNTLGTEESFFSMSGNSPDLLLVSTHGFYYSPENVPSWSSLNGYNNPMYLTGLVMSGGNAEYLKREIPDGVMGGLLTSSDIARLDLSGTQMVVLSACETGLGDTTNEGVYGLQRAFKKAGAQTLVMSLWSVSDLATKDFMILFHKELAENGWNKRLAFKNAKKSLRQKYDEPFYWAAFIMVD